ncbi:uncharacterized protein NECHADRAFT_87388 [Fusarium vanettenii 77-13-4]|uniref:NACHT-NTPase and P-loop NTPases N-terminal domain-containing protein n=1 Tax=Fusarium vanettenii (strain ATCC MYA-4622 / CBS 123669 / FGSC 9596 / NRRL 45880 / 77-13-4) TaxID=660122 RepID=C7ZE49_FUSV7|nr:uncharacterized protein NECHADRAFT_87388 [Fusarium vanettenii 77-13-4]EEU37645.1 predicted protein [Fusarium vanettenii 77-13-4]
MKSSVVFSIFSLLLAPGAAVPAPTSTGVESVADTLDSFFPLFSETIGIIENIDFDNAQQTAEASSHGPSPNGAIRDKLNEILDVCVLLVERFYETKGKDNIKKLNHGEQKEVCDKFDQIFFGIDFIRHRPLRTLVPLCKDKAEGNAKEILEDLKILIRAYGGTTECSRLGGPVVNGRKTCAGSGHSTWELPGGIQF